MNCILQGNTKYFNVDEYLSKYHYVYWSVNHKPNQFHLNQKVYIWRARTNAGIVATGLVKEIPARIDMIRHAECLGDECWEMMKNDPSQLKIGIEVSEVRLTERDGFVPRKIVELNETMKESQFIKVRSGSSFILSDSQDLAMKELWSSGDRFQPNDSESERIAFIRKHIQHERSRVLVDLKRNQVTRNGGIEQCELCKCTKYINADIDATLSFFEVHNIVPLSSYGAKKTTSIDDLVYICANCHRLIHGNTYYEDNYNKLKVFFKRRM